jgi:hypothetical protein
VTAGTRERLEGIIAAESACCSFLGFDLGDDAGELVLTVTAPEGAEPLAFDLVNAFAGDGNGAARCAMTGSAQGFRTWLAKMFGTPTGS